MSPYRDEKLHSIDLISSSPNLARKAKVTIALFNLILGGAVSTFELDHLDHLDQFDNVTTHSSRKDPQTIGA